MTVFIRLASVANTSRGPVPLFRRSAGLALALSQETYQLGTASSTSELVRPTMNADDIIANDAHRDALQLFPTAFTRWGVAHPADPVGHPSAVRELRV